MILQALVEHYENLAEQGKISQPGWCCAKISYAIELGEDGSVKAVIPMKFETDAGKKKVFIPSPMTVPEMVTRSSGVSANFLCDNANTYWESSRTEAVREFLNVLTQQKKDILLFWAM